MLFILTSVFSWFFIMGCKPKTTSVDLISMEVQKNSQVDTITESSNEVDTSFNITQKDDTLYNIIESISEVKDFIKKNNSKNSNKKVDIIINKRPDKTFNYYWLQVGLSDKHLFQPVYNFYIKPESFQVLYYNTSADSPITLKKWRETRGW